MRQPYIIVGCGTEVSGRVLLPLAERLRQSEGGGWPEHVCLLMADGDEQTRARHAARRLPADRAPFVPLSMVQVRDALAWRPEEFEEAWREPWEELLHNGPDNGACMIPAVGRLMLKAARPTLIQHLEGFARRLEARGAKVPEIFCVFSPVSGTSRGSIYDLPRYCRAVFPDAAIEAVVLHPQGLGDLDPDVARIFQTNFVEAARVLERHLEADPWEAWVDDSVGHEVFEARAIDNVFAFDGRYGNTRLRRSDAPSPALRGGLGALCDRVVDMLAGIAAGDPLWARARARFADAEMHRSEGLLEGHRTAWTAVHELRARLDEGLMREALVEHAMARIGDHISRLATPPDPDEVRTAGGLTLAPAPEAVDPQDEVYA